MAQSLGILGVPSSAGAFAPGQEQAPQAVRSAGLADRLQQFDITAVDHGDASFWRWRPDREQPRCQNLEIVRQMVRDTAIRVAESCIQGELPMVLGGDCTVGIGTVAGLLSRTERLGLLYFDLHPDLNIPAESEAGALDWMGVAHMLNVDGAAETLATAGPRTPMLEKDDLLMFGWGPDEATKTEQAFIKQFGLNGIDIVDVSNDANQSALSALEFLEKRADQFAIHFDVDVIDFTDEPLSENTGRNVGLTFDQAFAALEVLLNSPKLAALTITELNPLHGEEDGSTVTRFVDALTYSLSKSPLLIDD